MKNNLYEYKFYHVNYVIKNNMLRLLSTLDF